MAMTARFQTAIDAIALVLIQWPFAMWLLLFPVVRSGYQLGLGTGMKLALLEIVSVIVGGVFLIARLILVYRTAEARSFLPTALVASPFIAAVVAALALVMLIRSEALCHDGFRKRSPAVELVALTVAPQANENSPSAGAVRLCRLLR